MVDFGKRLKNLRTKKLLTQEQLATQLSLTKSVISAYENEIRMPSYDVLIGLTQIFNVSADYLLGIESSNSTVDLSGLSEEEVYAIKTIVKAMK